MFKTKINDGYVTVTCIISVICQILCQMRRMKIISIYLLLLLLAKQCVFTQILCHIIGYKPDIEDCSVRMINVDVVGEE